MTRGEGVNKSETYVDIIYGSRLTGRETGGVISSVAVLRECAPTTAEKT